MDSIDIWRTAATLISYYGDEASLIAVMRADALLGLGELDGYRTWLQVEKAIAELKRKEPREDERSH